MGVGAVAEILEDVLLGRERRLTDPADALGAHMADGRGAPRRHIERHAVTADPGHGAAAVGNLGRGVVRTARAEVGRALQRDLRLHIDRMFEGFQSRQPLFEHRAVVTEPPQPRHQRGGYQGRIEFALARQQRCAALVLLAHHRGAMPGFDIIEDALELVLDEAALLLDHQHVLQPFRELPRAALFQGPGQRHLVDAQAERFGVAVADAEIGHCLPQIEIGLAGGDDTEPRRLAVEHDAVERIGAGEGGDRRHLRTEQPTLRLHRRIGPADVEPVRRHLEIGRNHDSDARRVAVDRSGAFHRLRDRLEADPATRVARQREAEDAEVEIILQGGWVDDRHQRCGHYLFALMRQGRGLAAVVVAGQRQHAAVARGAGGIGMLQGIDRAVDAGALAVPDAEHAIDLGARKQPDLLAAPHRGRREILVEAGHEGDVVLLQERFRAPQRVVVHAERRAAIARDEARGVEAGGAVAFTLQHRQPHQRLHARQVDPLGVRRGICRRVRPAAASLTSSSTRFSSPSRSVRDNSRARAGNVNIDRSMRGSAMSRADQGQPSIEGLPAAPRRDPRHDRNHVAAHVGPGAESATRPTQEDGLIWVLHDKGQ